MKKIALVCALLLLAGCVASSALPKVGEVWKYSTGDPFNTVETYYLVLDIKGKHVQYVNLKYHKAYPEDKTWYESSSIRWFMIGAVRCDTLELSL